jgi:hypothetical protein
VSFNFHSVVFSLFFSLSPWPIISFPLLLVSRKPRRGLCSESGSGSPSCAIAGAQRAQERADTASDDENHRG